MSELRLTKEQLEILEMLERIGKKLRRIRRLFLNCWEIDAFIRRQKKRTARKRRA